MRNKTFLSGDNKSLNIINTILVIILVIMFVVFGVNIMKKGYTYIAEPADILRDINDSQYDDAIYYVNENRANGVGVDDNPEYKEPYAIVDYLQASLDYKMYLDSGDSRKAADSKAKMDEAFANMGKLKYKAAEIDKMIKGE